METFRKFMIRGDVLAACGLATIAGMAALGIRYDFNRGDWAAWVQAVGSVTALAVAIFVMSRQNAHATKLIAEAERQSTLRFVRSVTAIMERTSDQITYVIRMFGPSLQPDADYPLLELLERGKLSIGNAKERLIAIPLHELGSYKMTRGAQQMIEAINSYMHFADNIWNHPRFPAHAQLIDDGIALQESVDEAMANFRQGAAEIEQR